MPTIIDASKARQAFSEIINKVLYAGEEFIVQRQGKPVALITGVKKKKKAAKSYNFLKKIAGYKLKGAPPDLAKNHDKYTWG